MPDGRIVVGGFSQTGATIFGFTATGQPDTSFGQGGQVALPSARGNASIALQGDNIVAAASDSTGRLVVFRLLPNGALDPSFGSAGVAATNLSSAGLAPQVAIASDRKIVVASTSAPIAGLVVARMLPDGDGFDPSFGGGVVYDTTTPLGFGAQAVAAGPGDKVTVLAAGFADTSRVLRFAADGTLDPSFGSGGNAVVEPGEPAYLFDMALRPDGSSVVVGRLGTSAKGVIAALTPAGQLDPTFAADGATETPGNGISRAVEFDSQGRILAAGSGSDGLGLIRYLPNGSVDPDVRRQRRRVRPVRSPEHRGSGARVHARWADHGGGGAHHRLPFRPHRPRPDALPRRGRAERPRRGRCPRQERPLPGPRGQGAQSRLPCGRARDRAEGPPARDQGHRPLG